MARYDPFSPKEKDYMSKIIAFPESYRYSERWFVLGDISNSTCFLARIREYTLDRLNDKNELYFELTKEWNKTVESIFRAAEVWCPKNASLGNTMGDGFLLVGPAGKGNSQVKPYLEQVLKVCRKLKLYADEILSNIHYIVKESIAQKISNNPKIYIPKMKLAIHHGPVVEAVGKQRYIGDCINYLNRMTSSIYKSEKDREDRIILATDHWFKLLIEKMDGKKPKGCKKIPATIHGYPCKNHKYCKKNVWIIEIPKDKVIQKEGKFPEIEEQNAMKHSFWKLFPLKRQLKFKNRPHLEGTTFPHLTK